MWIFLDESGDLGFDFRYSGTSSYFVITLLVCFDYETLKTFDSAVKHTLRRKVNFKRRRFSDNELKSSNLSINVKRYFFEQLKKKKKNFKIYSIVLNKQTSAYCCNSSNEREHLYNELSKNIISNALTDIKHGSNVIDLIVDKSKNKAGCYRFNKKIMLDLEKLFPKVSMNIYHELSHEHAGLQAVDLFCGGILKKYSDNNTEWYQVFSECLRVEIEIR